MKCTTIHEFESRRFGLGSLMGMLSISWNLPWLVHSISMLEFFGWLRKARNNMIHVYHLFPLSSMYVCIWIT